MYAAVVLADVTVTWDHTATVIPAGTTVGLTAGSALETAIGTANLLAVTSDQDVPAVGAAVSN